MKSPLLTYIGFVLATIVGLFLINTFNIAYPVTVTTKAAPADLAVVGEGKVTVVPDTATLQAGITVNGNTAAEAQEQINQVNNKLVEALKKLGIAKEDISTSNYSINPNYDYTTGTNQINGYSGNATTTVKIKDTKILAQVVQEVTNAGANQVGSPQFSVDNPEKFRKEARDKAIANAKEEAHKLAKTLGIRLGKVTNIVESSPNTPFPMMTRDAKLMGLGAGESTPPTFEEGSQEITSTVTLYFEKK